VHKTAAPPDDHATVAMWAGLHTKQPSTTGTINQWILAQLVNTALHSNSVVHADRDKVNLVVQTISMPLLKTAVPPEWSCHSRHVGWTAHETTSTTGTPNQWILAQLVKSALQSNSVVRPEQIEMMMGNIHPTTPTINLIHSSGVDCLSGP
jgi:hypothetical protein